MTPDDRAKANDIIRTSKYSGHRTLVEVGSPDWHDFLISSGDYECPHCHSQGTVLMAVKANTYQSILYTKASFPYGDVIRGAKLGEFFRYLQETDNLPENWRDMFDLEVIRLVQN